jgi:hypothetical protein
VESPITLGADIGLAFYLAIGVTYAVQGVKWLLEILPTTRTNDLPSWVWVPLSMAVSVGICWAMKVDALTGMIKLDLAPPLSYIATGLGIAFSSNVLYVVSRPLRKKVRHDGKVVCLPAGEDVVPEAPVEQPAQQPEVIITPDVIVTPDNNLEQPDVLIKVGDQLVTPEVWHKATLLSKSIVLPDYVALDIGPNAKLYPVDK